MGEHKISNKKCDGYCIDKKLKDKTKKSRIDMEIIKGIDERRKYENNKTRESQQKYKYSYTITS